MEIEDFNNLTINERADILWEQSIWIDKRSIYNKYLIELYLMRGLYVEVFIDTNHPRIDNIKAVTEDEVLNTYVCLEQIL